MIRAHVVHVAHFAAGAQVEVGKLGGEEDGVEEFRHELILREKAATILMGGKILSTVGKRFFG
jgi:hypothetical protein